MIKKNNVIAVFVRNPELGKVKTRVAAEVGDEKALEIYHSLLEITFQTLLDFDENVVLYLTHHLDDFKNLPFERALQSSGDLGHKMFTSFSELCERYHNVILIGSDCPYITPQILQEAINKLSDHDVLIGPSTDGGYYLIGMKQPNASLFDNISWSTDAVLQETIDQVKKNNLSYALLESLTDIDYYKEWKAYLNSSKSV
jgi:rSAM/selenodomain-associated transferase 1